MKIKRVFQYVCAFFALLSLLASLPFAGGCGLRETKSTSFFLMDTVITVTLYDVTETEAEPIFASCRSLLAELEALWSKTAEASDTSAFNRSPAGCDIPVDERTAALLRKAEQVRGKTGGAFDVTVAPLVDLWNRCGERGSLPANEELADALASVGGGWNMDGTTLRKDFPDCSIDLGGIAKGDAAERLLDYLKTTGVQGGLVSFGSNVAVFGEKTDGSPFRVSLRDPANENGTVGKFLLADGQILSVSGDYERYVTIGGNRYHHILDPATGYPADKGLASVAVVCRDGALADALSTALFVLGADAAEELRQSGAFDFEAVFVGHDGSVTFTPGLDGIFLPA